MKINVSKFVLCTKSNVKLPTRDSKWRNLTSNCEFFIVIHSRIISACKWLNFCKFFHADQNFFYLQLIWIKISKRSQEVFLLWFDQNLFIVLIVGLFNFSFCEISNNMSIINEHFWYWMIKAIYCLLFSLLNALNFNDFFQNFLKLQKLTTSKLLLSWFESNPTD